MSNEKLLTLKVLTPEGIIFKKSNLLSINIYLADDRPIGIRPGHAPLIAATKNGALSLRDLEEGSEIQLHAGIMQIRNNSVIIVTSGLLDHELSDRDNERDIEYTRLMHTLVNQLTPGEK